MLIDLSIRDIVLIDQVTLELADGLCALTGETGAGKSILLDALGLALGERAGTHLLRHGAEKGVVTAQFELLPDSEAGRILAEHDIACDGDVVLRRVLSADGRSRAYINDQAVSIGLLRRLGECLVEVHGQHEGHGLLRVSTHRQALDDFGVLAGKAKTCAHAYREMQTRGAALAEARERLEQAAQEEDYLRHVHKELAELAPRAGEDGELAQLRALLRDGEQIAEVLRDAADVLTGMDGVDEKLRSVQGKLERSVEKAQGRLDPVLDALSRTGDNLHDGIELLHQASRELLPDPARLEDAEERLFAMREAARKHRVGVDDLPLVLADLATRLAAIDGSEDELERLDDAAKKAQDAYRKAAQSLSKSRQAAAKKLDAAVCLELPPLALDKAVFSTRIEPLEPDAWGPHGGDRIRFMIATNPGQELADLSRVASGGELSRIMLALKVVLAAVRGVDCMIFDEVDQGIGGAVADMVGERLARLSKGQQILVVTHSPQVAARADHHWRIKKATVADRTRTDVAVLDNEARREEIARMLAGAKITSEARAAADSLIAAGQA